MAGLAGLWEPALHVIRIRCVLEIRQVAGDAGRHRDVVIIVNVAIRARAGRDGMRTGQREGRGGVIKLRRLPRHGRVAILTTRGKQARLLRVIWIRRVVVVVLMTRDASRVSSRQIVVVVLVAIVTLTRGHGMASRENESCERMIEFGAGPIIRAVATLARSGGEEHRGRVSRVRGVAEILLMAADAIGGHRRELAETGVLVAVLAGSGRMRSSQGEAVVVHVDLGNGNIPSPDRMTVFAGAGHLAAMDVGVAVGALVADVREHHLGVAGHAIDAFVHATERKLGLVVVEFGNRTDRLPPVNGVAVLAGNIEVTVRTVAITTRLWGSRGRKGCRKQQAPHHPSRNECS